MASNSERPLRVGLTMGDPQGVGPELLVRAVAGWEGEPFVPIALGDAGLLAEAARRFAPKLAIREVSAEELPDEPAGGELFCVSLSQIDSKEMDAARPPGLRFGREVHRYLAVGCDLALSGDLDTLVTAPIAKTAFAAAGIDATGHTGVLAQRTGVGARHAMMLAGPRLRVTLATVHVPLKDVAAALTAGRIETAAELTYEWLVRRFGVRQPRIAVAGLNPHAGEGGMLGAEESQLIAPTVKALAGQGIDIEGPFSPDTVFFRAYEGEFDAVIAMYHDQGLIPLKLVHFHEGVNLTLGLPFVRTSPDHGTAFDIAWRGEARTESFEAALAMALRLAGRGEEVIE